MYKYLLAVILFLAMVPVAYAQEPICTDPDGPAEWQPFVARKPWYLPAGGTIYVKFRDRAGNESAVISRSR